ncbi:MAG: type II toxin-antitoxin system VapC family toxin [Deltaproteobacteria bacterium]|nr:type II toxin-antitoxin system VapC family toxin [Deltaproteobacteria bacterium]
MAAVKVLDSWALLCYLEQEPGFEKMIDLFEKAVESSKPLLMCIVNWGEVYYQIARRFGEKKAQEIEQLIQTLPITLVEANKELTRESARIKSTKPMAYADCFAVALARLNKAEVYTGDPEFKAIEKEIKVVWL